MVAGPLLLGKGKEIPYPGSQDRDKEMISSRMTSKAQTTIPQAVRKALRLRQGDEIAYLIESRA